MNGAAEAVSEDDVRALARTAQLPLGPGRAAALAGALEADLTLIRALRTVAVGEVHPLGVAPLPARWDHEQR